MWRRIGRRRTRAARSRGARPPPARDPQDPCFLRVGAASRRSEGASRRRTAHRDRGADHRARDEREDEGANARGEETPLRASPRRSPQGARLRRLVASEDRASPGMPRVHAARHAAPAGRGTRSRPRASRARAQRSCDESSSRRSASCSVRARDHPMNTRACIASGGPIERWTHQAFRRWMTEMEPICLGFRSNQ